MKFKNVSNKLTSKVGRQVLITKKHSPALMFGVGVIGIVGTVVLASRATLKLESVLNEAEKTTQQIDDAKALETDEYTEEDAKKDGALNKAKTAFKICKLYAPAFGLGVVTIGALTGSHVVLNRRNAGLTAAYTVLDKGFREYRERVVGEYGKEKDREFRYGVVEREIAVDTDEGVAVKTVKVFGKGKSMYAKIFDEYNPNWDPHGAYNSNFLRAQQNYANDILQGKGHVFLNDVYQMLGFERTSAGQVVGWVKGNGDNYIDFGILDDEFEGMRFITGAEKSVWLDFNVDGIVYDLI